jgi:solute carrier family 66 (lysosomal lysine-arginine transporter), member 1
MFLPLLLSFASQGHHDQPLTTREALSGILGSISLACWLFLLAPQLVENYRNGSAEAISLAFIFVWFLGDICNLVGALWAGLVPVIIAIAVYFCIADGVLIGQCLYYGIRNKRREAKRMLRADSVDDSAAGATEEDPLLPDGRRRSGSVTIPGSMERRASQRSTRSRRRSSRSAQQARDEQLAKILEESDERGVRLWFKNILSILAIIIVGAVGWAVAYGTGAWKPTPMDDVQAEEMATGAQILGYASAVLYLGARLPQIYKNYSEKSCEGRRGTSSLFIHVADGPRSLVTFLYPVLTGKFDVRRWHSITFNGEGIRGQERSMVDR